MSVIASGFRIGRGIMLKLLVITGIILAVTCLGIMAKLALSDHRLHGKLAFD